MSTVPPALCDQPDCPITTEGRCLEGFQAGAGCPHLLAESTPEPDELTEEVDDIEEEDVATVPETVDQVVQLGGGESLTTPEAHDIAAEYGAEIILIAGEFKAGKTTLMIELYSRFLEGPVGGWLFAGSRTLVALDKRHLPTRYASGNVAATTERTQPEHEGLIHLRIVKEERTVPLFFTDLRGERFEHVTDGVPAAGEVPNVARANRTMVLIDGEKIGDVALRQTAMHRGRQLIGGLTELGGVTLGRPMAIVLTKQDLVDADQLKWFAEQARPLAEFACERGADASIMTIAARPDSAPDSPQGLEHVVTWLTAQMPKSADEPDPLVNPADRQFWRLTVADPA